LIGPKLTTWNELLPRIANIKITQEQDVFCWNLEPKGQFSKKSHYSDLIHQDVPKINKIIWKTKAPLKIKIFMWYLRRGVILTKDNLVKRNWQGNEKCCFCHENKTIKHLFLECRFARVVWGCIQVALNLLQPRNISHLFGSWLRGFQKDLKPLILLGAADTCWLLWFYRNDLVFKKTCLLSVAGGLFGNPLAAYMGYPPKVLRTGFGAKGIATIDASSYDVFLPGT